MIRHRTVGLALSALLFPACYILPHTTQRYPDVRGRVVDECTLAPVAGAEVEYYGFPGSGKITGGDGTFEISPSYNFHVGYLPGMCTRDWPEGEGRSDTLVIRRSTYATRSFSIGCWKPRMPAVIALRPSQPMLSVLRLGSCLLPHVVVQHPAIDGSVEDAVSHQPIPGATVEIESMPGSRTTTDVKGKFHLDASTRLHTGLVLGGHCQASEWPENFDSHVVLRVEKDGYVADGPWLYRKDWDPLRSVPPGEVYVTLDRQVAGSSARGP